MIDSTSAAVPPGSLTNREKTACEGRQTFVTVFGEIFSAERNSTATLSSWLFRVASAEGSTMNSEVLIAINFNPPDGRAANSAMLAVCMPRLSAKMRAGRAIAKSDQLVSRLGFGRHKIIPSHWRKRRLAFFQNAAGDLRHSCVRIPPTLALLGDIRTLGRGYSD